MTTAVAAAPLTAPLAPPSVERTPTTRSYAPIAPSGGTLPATPSAPNAMSTSANSSPTSVDHPAPTSASDGRPSPTTSRSGQAPKILVKKEPSSPEMQASRHRPRRLDLSVNNASNQPGPSGRPSAPLTSEKSAGLAIQDLGVACLSPGFQTQDPGMQQQLQRSLDVRERQRQIIEARQMGKKPPTEATEPPRNSEGNPFRSGNRTPSTSRRKGPPPGLSIAPPSHQQFAQERVIQSAPLNQSFTGLAPHHLQPLSRQVANKPSSLSQTSHIHHVPATQTNNRLPPIADVFAGEIPGSSRDPTGRSNGYYTHSPGHSSHSNQPPPLPSPGFPPQAQHTAPSMATTGRPREYKSAEEAVHSLSGGREDLLPRIVHYGGHQPPTPPSPMTSTNLGLGGGGGGGPSTNSSSEQLHASSSSRRRGRDEYERDMGSPPLAEGARRGPFGEGRDTPETQRRKKEEFIKLCARAWDLFHS